MINTANNIFFRARFIIDKYTRHSFESFEPVQLNLAPDLATNNAINE